MNYPRLNGRACIVGAQRPRADATKPGTVRDFEYGCARYQVYETPEGAVEKIAKYERTNHTRGYFPLAPKGKAYRETAAAFAWAVGQPVSV